MTLIPDRKPEIGPETTISLTMSCKSSTAGIPGMKGCDGERHLVVNSSTGQVVDTSVSGVNYPSEYTYHVDPKEFGTPSEISAITAAHNQNVHPGAVTFGNIGY